MLKSMKKKVRLNKSIKKFSDSKSSITINHGAFERLLNVFGGKCAVTQDRLHSNEAIAIPKVIGGPVRSLHDLVIVSSSVTTRLSEQKGERLTDRARCVIHALESSGVKLRIGEAYLRLQRIEAAEKKLREEKEGNASPRSPLG